MTGRPYDIILGHVGAPAPGTPVSLAPVLRVISLEGPVAAALAAEAAANYAIAIARRIGPDWVSIATLKFAQGAAEASAEISGMVLAPGEVLAMVGISEDPDVGEIVVALRGRVLDPPASAALISEEVVGGVRTIVLATPDVAPGSVVHFSRAPAGGVLVLVKTVQGLPGGQVVFEDAGVYPGEASEYQATVVDPWGQVSDPLGLAFTTAGSDARGHAGGFSRGFS